MKFLITERQLKLFENVYKEKELVYIKTFFDENFSGEKNYSSEIIKKHFGTFLRIQFNKTLIDVWNNGSSYYIAVFIDRKKYNKYFKTIDEMFDFIKKEKLNEGLNLKSRANDQEKQREEYINQILSKGIENLNNSDFATLYKLDGEKKLFTKLQDKLNENEIESELVGLTVHGISLFIDETFYLKLFGDKLKLWLKRPLQNSDLNDRFYDITFTHDIKQDGMYLNFYNTNDLFAVLGILKDYIIKENLNLKSRAGQQEKQSIEYFTKKVKEGDVIEGMSYSGYNKLPDEIKTINIKNINNKMKYADNDYDEDYLYYLGHKDPYKTLIKNNLINVLKDRELLFKICDNFYWSDGSNGIINFDNLNHFINDIGYKVFEYNPEYFFKNDLNGIKKRILYAHASSSEPKDFIKERYKDFKYNPNDEFSW